MRKYFPLILGAIVAAGFGLARVNAQTEPPVNLPIFVPSATTTSSVDTGVITYTTVTPIVTATPASSVFVDDAETGTEIYLLVFLSIVAGMGLFFIKKYLDIKKYSI